MNCDCQQAKTLIALWAGRDLPASEERHLRRHVAVCPDCKEYARNMKSCMKQLHECSEPRLQPSDKCLWSSLKSSLKSSEQSRNVKRFNGWTAGLALAACFLAMFSIHQTMNQQHPENFSRSTNFINPHFVAHEKGNLPYINHLPDEEPMVIDPWNRMESQPHDREELEARRRMLKSFYPEFLPFDSDQTN